MDKPKPTFIEAATCLAGQNHGVFGRRDLIRLGMSTSAVDSRLNRGHLDLVFQGAYKFAGSELTIEGLIAASLLVVGETGVIGLKSAAALWGFMEKTTVINVLTARRIQNVRARSKVAGVAAWPWLVARNRRRMEIEDVTSEDGVPLTTPEATLRDLAAFLPEHRFRDVFSEADRLQKVDDMALVEVAERSQGMKGGSLLRELAESRVDGVEAARSRLESLLLELILGGQLPPPEVNLMIEGHLVDFVWPARMVIVETDGYEFHRGREAFEKDHARTNELRAVGWTVLRFTYRQVRQRPEYVLDLIRRALGADI